MHRHVLYIGWRLQVEVASRLGGDVEEQEADGS